MSKLGMLGSGRSLSAPPLLSQKPRASVPHLRLLPPLVGRSDLVNYMLSIKMVFSVCYSWRFVVDNQHLLSSQHVPGTLEKISVA